MKRRDRSIMIPAILLAIGGALNGAGAGGGEGVEAQADRLLREMSEHLRRRLSVAEEN